MVNNSAQAVGHHEIDESKRMRTERCAELMAAAMAYDLTEVWYVGCGVVWFTHFSIHDRCPCDFASCRYPTSTQSDICALHLY